MSWRREWHWAVLLCIGAGQGCDVEDGEIDDIYFLVCDWVIAEGGDRELFVPFASR